jgi:hypothetical protein
MIVDMIMAMTMAMMSSITINMTMTPFMAITMGGSVSPFEMDWVAVAFGHCFFNTTPKGVGAWLRWVGILFWNGMGYSNYDYVYAYY